MTDVILQSLPGVLVAIVVGYGGAWWASQKALATHAEKIRGIEARIADLDRRFAGFHAESAQQTLISVERLTRIETKVELALQRMDQWNRSSES